MSKVIYTKTEYSAKQVDSNKQYTVEEAVAY